MDASHVGDLKTTKNAKSTVRRDSVQQVGQENVILSIILPTNFQSKQRTTFAGSMRWQVATHPTTAMTNKWNSGGCTWFT